MRALIICALTGLSTSAAAEATVDVARYRGDAEAACSPTFDDALREDIEIVGPLLDDVGIHATFFVVIDWLQTTNYGTDSPWDAWRALAAAGNEIGSHTMTHPSVPSLDADGLAYEIVESHDVIEHEIGIRYQTFAFPGSSSDDASAAFVEQHYLEWRDWRRQHVVETSDATADTVDAVMQSGEWLVPIIHAIDDDNGYDNWPSSELRAFAELIRDTDGLWVDTFGTVARYVKERDAVSIGTVTASETQVSFTPTSSLDAETFDALLTFVIHGLADTGVLHASRAAQTVTATRRANGDVIVDAVVDGSTIVVSVAEDATAPSNDVPVDEPSDGTPPTTPSQDDDVSRDTDASQGDDVTMPGTRVTSSCAAASADSWLFIIAIVAAASFARLIRSRSYSSMRH